MNQILLTNIPDDLKEKHRGVVDDCNLKGQIFYTFMRKFYEKMLKEMEAELEKM